MQVAAAFPCDDEMLFVIQKKAKRLARILEDAVGAAAAFLFEPGLHFLPSRSFVEVPDGNAEIFEPLVGAEHSRRCDPVITGREYEVEIMPDCRNGHLKLF